MAGFFLRVCPRVPDLVELGRLCTPTRQSSLILEPLMQYVGPMHTCTLRVVSAFVVANDGRMGPGPGTYLLLITLAGLLISTPIVRALRTGENVFQALLQRILLFGCYALALFLWGNGSGGECGWLTCPLADMVDYASLLFLLAAILVFLTLRGAAIFGLLALGLCWPSMLYAVDPRIISIPVTAIHDSILHLPDAGSTVHPHFSLSLITWMMVVFMLTLTILNIQIAKGSWFAAKHASQP